MGMRVSPNVTHPGPSPFRFSGYELRIYQVAKRSKGIEICGSAMSRMPLPGLKNRFSAHPVIRNYSQSLHQQVQSSGTNLSVDRRGWLWMDTNELNFTDSDGAKSGEWRLTSERASHRRGRWPTFPERCGWLRLGLHLCRNFKLFASHRFCCPISGASSFRFGSSPGLNVLIPADAIHGITPPPTAGDRFGIVVLGEDMPQSLGGLVLMLFPYLRPDSSIKIR